MKRHQLPDTNYHNFLKQGREMRHIPMNDRVVEILGDLPGRMKSEWVFPNMTGNKSMDGNNFIKRVFIPSVSEAKIKNLTRHDLRHTLAAHLVMARIPLTTVKELLGHQSLTMTLKYAHLAPPYKLKAISVLHSAINDTLAVMSK